MVNYRLPVGKTEALPGFRQPNKLRRNRPNCAGFCVPFQKLIVFQLVFAEVLALVGQLMLVTMSDN